MKVTVPVSVAANVAIPRLDLDGALGRNVERDLQTAGHDVTFFQLDISNAEKVKDVFEQIQRRFGGLNVLYNNASVFLRESDSPVDRLTVDVWHRILSVNLHGLFYCCKYAVPLLIGSGGGSIINTSSSAGVIGIPGCDAYTASKGATISLTRSMAVEYGRQKIRVNCIAPAAVSTPMLRESSLDDPAFDEQAFFLSAPLGRFGTPEEIANIALFLASEESSYLNGAVLIADGGITIT